MAQVPETFTVKIGDGVSTQFSFDFPYLHSNDVYIEVDEVPVGFTYTTGNTVTLNSAPAAGAVVYMYRSTPAEQPAYDFQLGAPFLPAFIDENFRQLLYAVQEGIDRTAEVERQALRVPDNAGIPALPGGAERAGKLLSFDAAGNPVVQYPSSDSAEAVSAALATVQYAANLEITDPVQIVQDGDSYWRVAPDTALPYTTVGAGMPEGGAFVPIGDAALRQELDSNTAGQGSDLIAHTGTSDTVTEALDKRVIYVGSVAELGVSTFPEGSIVMTPSTKWRIGFDANGEPTGGGLYAEPVSAICIDDWDVSETTDFSAQLNQICEMASYFGIRDVYSKGGRTYYIEDTIDLSGISVDLDFNWSTLSDNVQGLRSDLSGRAAPTFVIYNSHGCTVRQIKHVVAPTRSQAANGNSADVLYWVGGQQMGPEFTTSPTVEDIVLTDTRRGCMPVVVIGNVYDWLVNKVDVYGDASWGINIEWGWQGTESDKTGFQEDPAVNQTLENGQIPHNGRVISFNGYELQNNKGFLRTAGHYNTSFENCVGYNVDNFIYVYGGDKNPSVFTQNDRFSGCKSKINRQTFTKTTRSITVLFPNKDGTLGGDLPVWTDYDHTVVFDDCEIQANYVDGSGVGTGWGTALRLFGCNGAVVFNRCTFKNSFRAAHLEKASDNPSYTSRFSVAFNDCIFEKNMMDVYLDGIEGVVFDHCKFKQQQGTEEPSVYIGKNTGSSYNSFRDCLWYAQNDRSTGVQEYVRLNTGEGNHLEHCRFVPYNSSYKPIAQVGSGIFSGRDNSTTASTLVDISNTVNKIKGERSTTVKNTSGLSGNSIDFNIGETWNFLSALTLDRCVNGESGDILILRGVTSNPVTIEYNATPPGEGRFLNLSKADITETTDSWSHTYVNSGGDWYEV